MRRNRRNNVKKERMIMIASSAFVLAALTMTGVYVKDRQNQIKDDGYSIDFSALENDEDSNAIQNNIPITDSAQVNIQENIQGNIQNDIQNNFQNNTQTEYNVLENDLDYMPMEEAGSGLIEIPGLTDQESLLREDMDGLIGNEVPDAADEEEENTEEVAEEEDAETSAKDVEVGKTLHFAQTLARPAAGEVLIPYSMDSSVHFATLDQYKYNPAVIIAATEGDVVNACAEGKVLSVFENEEIGKAVTLDLGDGYEATYGQLKDITVTEGSYVAPGEQLGTVAAPTKYFSVEGTNVYFKLTQNGTPVNPEAMFQ